MSEQTEETPEVENPDAEPEVEIEGDDSDAEEADEEEQTTQATPEGDLSAESWRQIDVANDAYIKKVAKIVGPGAPLQGCETCQGRGFLLGEPAPEVPMVHPENLVECERCNGYGQIITGSRNPGHVYAPCTSCAGNGYITKPVVQENLYKLPEPAAITAQQAQMGQMMPDGTFIPFGTPPLAQPQTYTP